MYNILCVICTENIDKDSVTVVTRCGHLFHRECIQRWVDKSSTCPECRASCSAAAKVFLNFSFEEDLSSSTVSMMSEIEHLFNEAAKQTQIIQKLMKSSEEDRKNFMICIDQVKESEAAQRNELTKALNAKKDQMKKLEMVVGEKKKAVAVANTKVMEQSQTISNLQEQIDQLQIKLKTSNPKVKESTVATFQSKIAGLEKVIDDSHAKLLTVNQELKRQQNANSQKTKAIADKKSEVQKLNAEMKQLKMEVDEYKAKETDLELRAYRAVQSTLSEMNAKLVEKDEIIAKKSKTVQMYRNLRSRNSCISEDQFKEIFAAGYKACAMNEHGFMSFGCDCD